MKLVIFFTAFRAMGLIFIQRKFSKQLGDIAGICLGYTAKDGKEVKGEAFWHVEEVVVIEKELNNRILLICNALIPLYLKRDKFVTKTIESFASKARRLVTIKYNIITSNEKGVGTDANVFISIYGSNCCGRSPATCLSVARRTASCWSCWTQSRPTTSPSSCVGSGWTPRKWTARSSGSSTQSTKDLILRVLHYIKHLL
ncbi:lipoxygenase homology domain-containing protein 1-like [Oncorhynchus mykiss]|uniref:lipoxygenase homology domain-containing protein 1-like n=1 Tax=Oncorhynchus mykiss TaxID=8022 RepID=UPI001878BF19|nr:lipoxygenase homology domain-containing protein 1-like [Oncorhynchus mykiss]